MSNTTQNTWSICLRNRKLYYCAAAIAIVLAVVVSLSTPTIYKSQVMLAVEWSAPMNVMVGANEYADEILKHRQAPSIVNDPFVYAKILKSPQFIDSLKKEIVVESGGASMPLSDHLRHAYRQPWWESSDNRNVDDIIRRRLKSDIKIKTGLLIVQYADEDPAVSAAVAGRMTTLLDAYFRQMNAERTKKEVDFYREQRDQQYKAYQASQKKYSDYHDSHLDISLQSEKSQLDYLSDDVEKQYDAFRKAATMYKRAEMKQQQQLLVSSQLRTSQTYTTNGLRMWMVNIFVALFYAILLVTWWVLIREVRKR